MHGVDRVHQARQLLRLALRHRDGRDVHPADRLNRREARPARPQAVCLARGIRPADAKDIPATLPTSQCPS